MADSSPKGQKTLWEKEKLLVKGMFGKELKLRITQAQLYAGTTHTNSGLPRQDNCPTSLQI